MNQQVNLKDQFIARPPVSVDEIKATMQEAFFDNDYCMYCGNNFQSHIYHAHLDEENQPVPDAMAWSSDGRTPTSICWVRPQFEIIEE